MTEERVNYVNIAAGLCVVALGVLLLLQMNGMIQARLIVKLWPVALILIGGAVVMQSSRGGQVSGSVSGLIWIVLLGALFGHVYDRRDQGAQLGPGQISMFAVLGGDKHPPITGEFHGGQVTTVMGGANLDLRHAELAPGQTVVIDLFAVMGGTEIRMPANWQVDSQAVAIMGGVNDDRPRNASSPADPAPPRVVLKGTVLMGGVNIKS